MLEESILVQEIEILYFFDEAGIVETVDRPQAGAWIVRSRSDVVQLHGDSAQIVFRRTGK